MYLNYVSLILAFIILVFLFYLKQKKVKFGIRVFTGLILGIAIGTIFKEKAQIIEPIGKIYIGLIKMIVIPLVVTAIISSITSLKSPDQLKNIAAKSLAWLLSTTAIATVIGIIVALAFNLGSGMKFTPDTGFKAREIPAFSQVLLDMIPSNPVASMAEGRIIPIVVFSIFIAIAIIMERKKHPDEVKPVVDFIASLEKVMFRITKMVISLTPYGVFGLMAAISAKYGFKTLIPLAKVIAAVYIACAIQLIVVHGGLVSFVARVNPLRFYKKIYPAQMVAFTTQSSYGTLPVTIRSLVDRVKISEKIASFVASLGSTVGMNACGGLYPAIVAVFVAKVFNVELTFSHYLLLIAMTTISSIGVAGVPGTASIVATVVLTSLGLPIEGLAMVLGIDVILDMARTMTNVTGASVAALLVAVSEGEFDREAFYRDDIDEIELNSMVKSV